MLTTAARHPIIEEDLRHIAAAELPWTELGGRRVLISGASGFLPAYLVETLLYLNEQQRMPPVQIVGLVRNVSRAQARFAAYQGRSDLQWLEQDVSHPVSMAGDIDYIIHAASHASPKYFGADPVGTLSANVLGTHHLLELAREKSVKAFLFFSSGEVYGQPTQIPTPEEAYGYLDPLNVRSCYGESKRLGETMCVAWAHQYHVPAKIVRPFHTYGPGMRLDDGRVFADFVADIVNYRDIVLKSDGKALRPFCYLADATVGFFTALLLGTIGQAYNIGADQNEISIRDLAEMLAGLFPERKLKVIEQSANPTAGYLKSPVSRNCPDLSRIRALGWQPWTSIREGFERTVRSYE